MSNYPEHEKIMARKSEHEAITNFLEFVHGAPSDTACLSRWQNVTDSDGSVNEFLSGYVAMTDKQIADTVARYFGVDPKAFEEEKRMMLQEFKRAKQ